jgi:tungstate transport system ATP-binding protein
MYRLAGIRKRYNGRLVLDVDDLEIRSGELLTIIGPNGAGKSTLLRLLHFLEDPDEGAIHYDGVEIDYPVPLEFRRRIAMVFQRATLFNRSVRDNIAYGLKVRGSLEMTRVDAVMEKLDLRGLASENARTLSGGEAQRVSLAQALVLDPQVLLLDEPTANLDPYNADLIEAIIQAARENGAPTIILVSHHITQALRMADRVAVIFGGKITELDDAEGFVNKSEDPRTKAFLEGKIPY